MLLDPPKQTLTKVCICAHFPCHFSMSATQVVASTQYGFDIGKDHTGLKQAIWPGNWTHDQYKNCTVRSRVRTIYLLH
jgi:hypothetical protein